MDDGGRLGMGNAWIFKGIIDHPHWEYSSSRTHLKFQLLISSIMSFFYKIEGFLWYEIKVLFSNINSCFFILFSLTLF